MSRYEFVGATESGLFGDRLPDKPTRTAARRIAAIMPRGLADPFQAMSKAVPWLGLVRVNGRPRVTLTAVSRASSLMGMCPWMLCHPGCTAAGSLRQIHDRTGTSA